MRSTAVCAVALAVLAVSSGVVRGDDNFDDSDVLVLGESDFESTVKGEELMLVEFYAPWCGHCKHLKPEFGKAATDLKSQGVKLAKVDATVHSALAGRYKVSGYPKLFVFRNGRESDYNGPREHKGIVDYMRKQIGPAAKPLSTSAEFDQFTALSDKDRDFVVVGFFEKGKAQSQLHSSFLLVSSRMRDDFFFGIVSDPAIAKAAGVDISGDGAVVAFKAYDDKKTVYSGSTKTATVQEWVTQQSLPVVGEFTKDRAQRYQKRNLPIAKYFMKIDRSTGSSSVKQMQYVMNRLRPVAEEFAGRLIVTIAHAADFAPDMEALGWKGAKDGFVIEKTDGKTKYRFERQFTADNLKKFAGDALAGKVASWVKSEEIPATNDGPVTVVVGKTFNEIVNNDEKDVLIEFYAPWCGHCKTLAPKYEKLGKKFKDAGVKSVVIAKMDATANDYTPEYSVSGYPTIYFKPAGGKPKLYEGDRETTDFVSYIKKNGRTKWSFRK